MPKQFAEAEAIVTRNSSALIQGISGIDLDRLDEGDRPVGADLAETICLTRSLTNARARSRHAQ